MDYYVKPSLKSKCPSGDHPCKTLNEYANNTEDFHQYGDIRMLFLAGVHNLTKNLNFSQLDSVQMMPEAYGTLVKIQLLSCNMITNSTSRFRIENMVISGAKLESINVINTQELSLQGVNLSEISLFIRKDLGRLLGITIQDSLLEQSSQTGLQIIDLNSEGTLNLTVVNSSVARHQQGGIIIESSSAMMVTIVDSIIKENQLSQIDQSSGGAVGLGIYTIQSNTTVIICNTHFIHNQDLRGQPVVVYISRAKVIDVFDSEFRDNRGTAIQAANTEDNLRLHGNMVFHNNTGQQGGALSLASQTQVYFMPGLNVTFVNNHAEDVGGAIFVESTSTLYDANDPTTLDQCFYQFPALRNLPVNYSISFMNNSAKNGGNHVFGASLMSYCIVYTILGEGDMVRSNDTEIQRFFHFDDDIVSPISSKPSRICLIDPNAPTGLISYHSDCANWINIFLDIYIFPGLDFSLDVVLIGAEFGICTGTVHAQILVTGNSETMTQVCSQVQFVSQLSPPKRLKYSVYSKPSHKVLVLTATSEKVEAYGNLEEIIHYGKIYNSTGIIPPHLLTTPVYLNLYLLECPTGYYFNHTSMGCECNPKLCNSQITEKVFNGTAIIYNIKGNIWINAYNNGNLSGIIMHYNCPFDYCKITTEGLELTTPDSQCAMSHAGILCGKCAPGFSLAFGSNKCLYCSNNNHLVLLIFFAAAGFLLVFFIKILNMTVSQGTINGLIFYANIMWAYQSIFFSHNDNTDIGKLWFLKTFIAWLNLDFGIKICFAQGLTAYTKIWLQFVFPFYVWSIAGGMILLARCSEKITRLLGNNSVQVLATLFLLSYAKLLRSIITALMPATLFVFANNGEPVANQTQVVWGFDGNLPYGRVPHIFLLIFALLILILFWLPYTFVFLLIQPLRSGSEHWCLRWVNKWKPLFDAYTGPMKHTNQFWIGLLLLARFVLLLTYSLTYSSSPSTSVLALIMTIILLLTVLSYTGQVHDDPTKFNAHFLPEKISFRSILEISFLFNLAVVGGSFLYIDSVTDSSTSAKTSVVYASITFAFLAFIGIVVYHISYCLKFCRLSHLPRGYRSLDKAGVVAMPTTTTVGMDKDKPSSVANHSNYGSLQVHESVLTGST